MRRSWIGNKQDTAQAMSCGNTVIMVHLDQFVTKNVTLINEKEADAHPVMAIKLSASPIVHAAMQYKVKSYPLTLVEDLEPSIKHILGGLCY